MRKCVGKLQRGARRALIENNGQPITTADVLRAAYPDSDRFTDDQYTSARRAAKRFAVRVGRAGSKGRPVRWEPTPELRRLILGDD
jgi:hypothetical protein